MNRSAPEPPDSAHDRPRESGDQKEETGEGRRRGRPPGKRSSPDFEQVTIYIRKTTHQSAKIRLLQGEKSHQFSDLVEELLVAWLAQ